MGSWSLPDIPGLAGPDDLASVVRSYSTFTAEGGSSPPWRGEADRFHDVVGSAIKLAFHASMVQEEGSFPKLRLYIAGRSSNQPVVAVKLDVPLPLDHAGVSALKKLAPAANSLNHMLLVTHDGASLRCAGLAVVAPTFSPVGVGRSEWHLLEPDRPWGVTIRVDGPGSIRVSCFGSFVFRLHAGRITHTFNFRHLPPISELVIRLGDALTQGLDVRRMAGADGRQRQVDLRVMSVLEHIVAHMQAGHVGGALVFPGQLDTPLLDKSKYTTEAGALLNALHEFHLASKACSTAVSVEDLRQRVSNWQQAHNGILRAADAVALLSRVNGCVVLDDTLGVRAFGAKIRATLDSSRAALPIVTAFKREPADDVPVRALGTRHQSAFALCQQLPNTTVIVVSKDGDVRVAASDSNSVCFVESGDAVALDLPDW